MKNYVKKIKPMQLFILNQKCHTRFVIHDFRNIYLFYRYLFMYTFFFFFQRNFFNKQRTKTYYIYLVHYSVNYAKRFCRKIIRLWSKAVFKYSYDKYFL